MARGDPGLINRIGALWQRIRGQAPAPTTPDAMGTNGPAPVGGPTQVGEKDLAGDTSLTGTMAVSMITAWSKGIFELSSKRSDVYDVMDEMDDTVEEISDGLDQLASTALAGQDGTQNSFAVEFAAGTDPRAQATVNEMIRQTHLHEKSYSILREALKFGDKFLQPVVNASLQIVRVMQMPERSMHRYEDDTGLLREGIAEGEFAFEQRYEKTHQFIAGFQPWQIIHLRWNHAGEEKYGRALLYSARSSFKKLRAMEEALTVNWLTRAFARLVFLLDHTGLDEKTRQRKIKTFQESLLTTKMPDGSTGKDPLTVVKDVYLSVGYHTDLGDDGQAKPELTDVKAVNTASAGYSDLAPIKYYLRKVIRPLRIPPAFLGIEDEINAEATLRAEKENYAAFIRWIQSWYSHGLVELFDLALLLAGFDPRAVQYKIVWPAPFNDDEKAGAETDKLEAEADELRMKQGVIDPEWIATRRMGMTDEEWKEQQGRIAAKALEAALAGGGTSAGGVEDTETDQVEEIMRAGGVKALLGWAAERLSEKGLEATPDNVATILLEQGGGAAKSKPPASYTKADEAYRQGLQAVYDKWSAETAEALANMDPDDAEDMERKLEDALAVLLMLLHQHGERNLDQAFYLGYGGREVGSDGMRQIQAEIENNYHYLETSLTSDIRQYVVKAIQDFQDELRADRRKEAIALLIAVLATRKAHVDLYAGQYWHSLWTGWAQREKTRQDKAGIAWRLDPMAQHCRDCPGFAGDYANIDALLAATNGCLPGQGTQCDGKCRCWLDRA